MSKSTVRPYTTAKDPKQEVTAMKKATYDEKTAKAVFDAIKNGASIDQIAETFNVRTCRTIKSWLDRYYTKKKAIAGAIYAQLLENNKTNRISHTAIEEEPQTPPTQPTDVDTSEVATITEMTEVTVVESLQESEEDSLINELERVLKANSYMNNQTMMEDSKNPVIIDICSLLFDTQEAHESAIKTFMHILQSLIAISQNNIFCWHKEIKYHKHNSDSQLFRKVAILVLDYGDFFERDQLINYSDYRIISYREYKSFKEIINPLHVANIATEESLFSEFNHYELFPVEKKKSGWIGSEKNIKRAFCKMKGIKESEGQLILSPHPYKDHFFVKEGETVTFSWETASEIEIWKYEFHEGKFFDVGHRKGGAKSLLADIA